MASERPKCRWYQFSLRTLLVIVLLAGVGLGWFATKVQRARRQRRAVAQVARLGGWVYYDFQVDELGVPIDGAQLPGPDWLRSLMGIDFFARVEDVWMSGPEVGDSEMAYLESFPDLKFLEIAHAAITDAGLVHLNTQTDLKILALSGNEITDAGLVYVCELTGLVELVLHNCPVTDDGLRHLKGLTKLKWLSLESTPATDDGLIHLKGLRNLRGLNLRFTKVTDKGTERLHQALPNCKIVYGGECVPDAIEGCKAKRGRH